MFERLWKDRNVDILIPIIAIIPFFVLLVTVASVFWVYGFPGDDEPSTFELTIGQIKDPQPVDPGDIVTITYEYCNRSGEPGDGLIFSAWLSQGGTLVDQAEGSSLSTVRFLEGCQSLQVDRQVPMDAGFYRRIGFLLVVFSDVSDIKAVVSESVEIS